jgi:hypothetical protein
MSLSKFDPSRHTVGKIYRDAQMHGEQGVVIGDVNHEIKKGLVEDINEAIQEGIKEFGLKPFYVAIYEKSDLMLKRGLVRIRKVWKKRPYPEQDSMVFKIIGGQDVYFCWALPHRNQMINEINTFEDDPILFKDFRDNVYLYKHWENLRLDHFGFRKGDEGNWEENPHYNGDRLMSKNPDDIKVHMIA